MQLYFIGGGVLALLGLIVAILPRRPPCGQHSPAGGGLYTAAEQDEAAAELRALPPAALMLPRMIGDYGVMRAQSRRCGG